MHRGTLTVILFRAMVNFTDDLIAIAERADANAIGLWFIAAIGIVVIWGAKALTGKQGELNA
jgi:hypothetical protein